jgi:hypothetical protein
MWLDSDAAEPTTRELSITIVSHLLHITSSASSDLNALRGRANVPFEGRELNRGYIGSDGWLVRLFAVSGSDFADSAIQ